MVSYLNKLGFFLLFPCYILKINYTLFFRVFWILERFLTFQIFVQTKLAEMQRGSFWMVMGDWQGLGHLCRPGNILDLEPRALGLEPRAIWHSWPREDTTLAVCLQHEYGMEGMSGRKGRVRILNCKIQNSVKVWQNSDNCSYMTTYMNNIKYLPCGWLQITKWSYDKILVFISVI